MHTIGFCVQRHVPGRIPPPPIMATQLHRAFTPFVHGVLQAMFVPVVHIWPLITVAGHVGVGPTTQFSQATTPFGLQKQAIEPGMPPMRHI